MCELLIKIGELGELNCEMGDVGAVDLTTRILRQVAFGALPTYANAGGAVASPAINL